MSVSLHPYSYSRNGSVYEFTTDNGDEYVAYFIDRADVSPYFKNLYEFNFEVRKDNNSPKDERIADTICAIMNSVFADNRNAIITNCETLDHREQGRYKLFQQWYTRFQNTDICKIDKLHRSEDYDLYSSLFIHVKNPYFDHIVRDFLRMNENGFIEEQ